MRTIAAAILGIAFVVLRVAGAGQAHGWIPVAGTIQAFDCQNNSLVLRGQDGVHVFTMAPNAAVFINARRRPSARCGNTPDTMRLHPWAHSAASFSPDGLTCTPLR